MSGLKEKVKHKEKLRQVHLLYPTMLPAEIVDSIRPDKLEATGLPGTISDPSVWKSTEGSCDSVTFRIHLSSDGVSIFKTSASNVRCIMASLDSLHSPKLGITVPIPDSPPFIVGIYSGKEKNSDRVLESVVDELLKLSPHNTSRAGAAVYCEATAWLCDAIERCAVFGVLGTNGTVSCHGCEQEGKRVHSAWQQEHLSEATRKGKKNHVYFPDTSSARRADEKWDTYTEILGQEVIIATFNTHNFFSSLCSFNLI